jgi:hypothetical protein
MANFCSCLDSVNVGQAPAWKTRGSLLGAALWAARVPRRGSRRSGGSGHGSTRAGGPKARSCLWAHTLGMANQAASGWAQLRTGAGISLTGCACVRSILRDRGRGSGKLNDPAALRGSTPPEPGGLSAGCPEWTVGRSRQRDQASRLPGSERRGAAKI